MLNNDSSHIERATKVRTLKLLIAAAAGSLFYFLLQVVAPYLPQPSVLSSPFPAAPKGHPVFAFVFRLQHLLASPFMQPIFLAYFVLLTVVRRSKPNAWVTAFLVGLGLPYVVFRLLGLI
jgi:hypothetical protein